MKRAVLISAAAATVLLSGCVATVGDLQRGAANLTRSAQAAVTPNEVMVYNSHADAARPILEQSIAAMKKSGIEPKLHSVKVTFRDAIGRKFESPDTVSSFRFAVPQDAIDADDKSLAPMLSALGAKFTAWNSVEPIELVAISADGGGADDLVSQLRKAAPGLKVTKLVGSPASVGYAGVELRMLNPSLSRTISK